MNTDISFDKVKIPFELLKTVAQIAASQSKFACERSLSQIQNATIEMAKGENAELKALDCHNLAKRLSIYAEELATSMELYRALLAVAPSDRESRELTIIK